MTDLAVRTDVGGSPASAAAKKRKPRKRSWAFAIRRDWQLYSLAVLPVAFFVIFRYLPMAGNVIAFRKYRPGGSIFGEYWRDPWWFYFDYFLHDAEFWHVFSNTLIIGALTLVFTYPLPIILALLLNELRSNVFKRFVQSVSYLPHFLSIVVVVSLIQQTVAVDGLANQAVKALGHTPIPFIQQPEWFRTIFVTSEVWQQVGFGTILYLAALTAIDEQLYEAAKIDGAGRWRQTWHVTLPGIRPTMVTLLILNLGTVLGVSFEKVFLLLNPLTYSTGDIVTTYLYRIGLESGSFSLAAAIGLFESLIGLVLIMSANFISKRVVGTSLW